MKRILVRLTAALDDAVISDYFQRALVARQAGAVLEKLDMSKASARTISVYATVLLPEDVSPDGLRAWLERANAETPTFGVVMDLLEEESRRLDAEAKGVAGFSYALAQPVPTTAPLAWMPTETGAVVVCPRCGNPVPVDYKDVLQDGTVGTKLFCPWACGWTMDVRLYGWTPPSGEMR